MYPENLESCFMRNTINGNYHELRLIKYSENLITCYLFSPDFQIQMKSDYSDINESKNAFWSIAFQFWDGNFFEISTYDLMRADAIFCEKKD